MPKQESIIKIKGKIGDLSFYKSKDGFMVRTKGGIDANRIKNDPAFVRTRENGAEFGHAGKASKLFRRVFRPLILGFAGGRIAGRLTQAMMAILQTDTTSVRGERKVQAGNLSLLTGFEFNRDSALGGTLFMPYTATLNRVTGEARVDIPAFTPQNAVTRPEGATHFKLVSAAAAIDFNTGESVYEQMTSAEIALRVESQGAIALSQPLPPGVSGALFLALGVEFYQEVNGLLYGLRNGAYNALAIIQIDQA